MFRMRLSIPDLSTRLNTTEWMDRPSAGEEHLRSALRDIQLVNRLLGGYSASAAVLTPLMRQESTLRMLDVGTGLGDHPVHFIRRGDLHRCRVDVTGIDLNPVIVGLARAHLDSALSPRLRSRGRIEIHDALRLPYSDNSFDVSHAALFLHHFHGADAVRLLRELDRVSRHGIVINDLHRHLMAYAGICLLTRLLRMAPMVQHDGPISVRRGFSKPELQRLSQRADLSPSAIRWHWAFRWTLSTVRLAEMPSPS